MDTNFRERFEAIEDIEELLSVAAPQYRDPETYFTELIANETNKNIAEKRLRVLEDLVVRSEEDKAKKELERLRRERNELLRSTDWTQLPDAPLPQQVKKFYRKYREYLRELPEIYKSNKFGKAAMRYDEWLQWLETVRYTPGFEKYIP